MPATTSLTAGAVVACALRPGKCKPNVAALVRAMVDGRPRAPGSTPGGLRGPTTVAMPAMPDGVTHRHLPRAMDALMDHAGGIEAEPAKQVRPLVDHELTLIFDDLITMRIHGEGQVAHDLRAVGMNQESGGIAPVFVPGVGQVMSANRVGGGA